MIRKPIRNVRSLKDIPPRVFDVVVDGEKVDLEVKIGKNTYETIPWQDVVNQV